MFRIRNMYVVFLLKCKRKCIEHDCVAAELQHYMKLKFVQIMSYIIYLCSSSTYMSWLLCASYTTVRKQVTDGQKNDLT